MELYSTSLDGLQLLMQLDLGCVLYAAAVLVYQLSRALVFIIKQTASLLEAARDVGCVHNEQACMFVLCGQVVPRAGRFQKPTGCLI